jgi:hypothetical protein
MFSLREFIKNGFINAIGNMADYQIILNAAGWFEKGVLTEDDLSNIEIAIKAKNNEFSIDNEELIEEMANE